MSIWTIIFVVLLIGGFTVFHVAGGLIHLLLVFAVISLVLHFVNQSDNPSTFRFGSITVTQGLPQPTLSGWPSSLAPESFERNLKTTPRKRNHVPPY